MHQIKKIENGLTKLSYNAVTLSMSYSGMIGRTEAIGFGQIVIIWRRSEDGEGIRRANSFVYRRFFADFDDAWKYKKFATGAEKQQRKAGKNAMHDSIKSLPLPHHLNSIKSTSNPFVKHCFQGKMQDGPTKIECLLMLENAYIPTVSVSIQW
ncbi:hypothetical protein M9H77_19092 [Catharanthus roseus]|uniref:Uncharacterized protein n=1 Tax=Catharanthus roseus TaxID=4058 RepID=A0ACC0B9B4_CATRO|nr:hypothetical protein M9H77_19092 [Catharanthus roseus]